MANLETLNGEVLEAADAALALQEDTATAYRNATSAVRRLFNQAFFVRIEIDEEEISSVEV